MGKFFVTRLSFPFFLKTSIFFSLKAPNMDVLKSLVQPLVGGTAGSSVIDGMKLVVLGGTVETARRVSSSAWYLSP